MLSSKRFRRILHPSDFSRASARAFAKAVELAKDNRAELLLLHVYTLPVQMMGEAYIPPDTYAAIEASMRGAAKKRLDAMIARAKEAGVRARAMLVEGTPHVRIARTAASSHADLIVMGTHGRTGLARAFLGSVAARALSSAPCPVVTVRGR